MAELIGRFGKGREIRIPMAPVRLAVLLVIELTGSVIEAAKSTGLSRNTLLNYKSGKHAPYVHKLQQLAKIVGIPVDWLA